ncbi:ABC multidrug transporter Mdr1 [Pyrenophora tritici-repentis]|nr:ABC multidrug transporter Mdr1 [Pyrenophora tritici-repentis]
MKLSSRQTDTTIELTDVRFRSLPHQKQQEKARPDAARDLHFHDLFRYASKRDTIIVAFCSMCAVATGALRPFLMQATGSVAGIFRKYHIGQASEAQFLQEVAQTARFCLYLGIIMFVTSYCSNSGFVYTGQSISDKIRRKYFHSILHQDMEYFEQIGTGEIAMRTIESTETIQSAISERVPQAITRIALLATICILGLMRNWKLSLILLSGLVPTAIAVATARAFIKQLEKQAARRSEEAASFVQEVFANIQNAMAFCTQEKLSFLIIALGFWQGNKYIASGQATVADVVTIVLLFSIGVRSASGFGANVQVSAAATAAARNLYLLIDRLDVESRRPDCELQKLVPSLGDGKNLTIEFHDVTHVYTSRSNVTALKHLSLRIQPNKLTAIIGPSGSGKSTLLGLIQRFYEPCEGQIVFGGYDIRSLDVNWLRKQCALVSQEPFLFDGTIAENVRLGMPETWHNRTPHDIQQEVEKACRLANAHDFIEQLPDMYNTQVGRRGASLSMGQRQRISIARAIIGQPKVLLLDEPCSALDAENARAVEASIMTAAQGRTTIVVSHQLESIRHADVIVVMDHGGIVEQGTHTELMANSTGTYRALANTQGLASESKTLQPDQTYRASRRRRRIGSPVPVDSQQATPSGKGRRKSQNASSGRGIWTLAKFITRMTKKELVYTILHFIAVSAVASARPVAALIFVKCIASLSRSVSELHRPGLSLNTCGWTLLCHLSNPTCSSSSRAVLSPSAGQDVSYFEKHAAASLTILMIGDMACLPGLSAVGLSPNYTGVFSLYLYFLLAVTRAWKLALVCASPIPLVFGMTILRKRVLPRFRKQMKALYRTPAAFISEVCTAPAMKTIASLACEDKIEERYVRQVQTQGSKLVKGRQKNALVDASTLSLTFFCMALAIWYGGQLVVGKDKYTIQQVFICIKALTLGVQELSSGRLSGYNPQTRKAREAATALRDLTMRSPEINVWSESGQVLESLSPLSIEFRNVSFHYPERPEWVVEDLSLNIQAGQYVALVGPSGCGKSTIIALLERFYDPQQGSILVNGRDIREYNIKSYRAALALVAQESLLYQTTIRENLLLGLENNIVSEAEIVEACKDASAYSCYMSLPNGLDTLIGTHGSTLSGGEKQRVAIARALLRKPKLLLLDEATAALDSKNENVIKAALDSTVANRTRTTVTVAHRLNTVRAADVIYLLDGGSVVDHGTFDELLERNGTFRHMAELQNLLSGSSSTPQE